VQKGFVAGFEEGQGSEVQQVEHAPGFVAHVKQPNKGGFEGQGYVVPVVVGGGDEGIERGGPVAIGGVEYNHVGQAVRWNERQDVCYQAAVRVDNAAAAAG